MAEIPVIKQILENADRVCVDEVDEPDLDILPHDCVLGTCSDSAKIIYALRAQAFAQSNTLKKRLLHIAIENQGIKKEPSEFTQLKMSYFTVAKQWEILDKIFWLTLHEEFPILKTKAEVGIRRGWKVVWVEKPCLALPELLQGLMDIFGTNPPENPFE